MSVGENREASEGVSRSPLPPSELNKKHHDAITSTAEAILSARALYPDSLLADLYDSLTMPPVLRSAHVANDRAVLAAYGLSPAATEREIVARLFRLYAEKTAMRI
jgi:hypothetical protein